MNAEQFDNCVRAAERTTSQENFYNLCSKARRFDHKRVKEIETLVMRKIHYDALLTGECCWSRLLLNPTDAVIHPEWPTTSPVILKRQYRKIARLVHPDQD